MIHVKMKDEREYKNLADDYPELSNKQLLSLIRANRLIMENQTERIERLENRIKEMEVKENG